MRHGAILGALSCTPDLDAALADYRDVLRLDVVAQGPLDPALAASWGVPGSAGRQMAVLRPGSGADCCFRLVEQPLPDGFRPTRTFGWAAWELTVKDVFALRGELDGSGVTVLGEPKEIAAIPFFVAMQALGRGQEMLYFNETRAMMPGTDLPFAVAKVDQAFIAILAAPDRAAAVAWYRDALKLDEADTFRIPYSMINKAFDLPADHITALTMIQQGRMPIVEIDEYPAAATPRTGLPASLPPGNAMLTLAVDSLDALALDWIALPAVRTEAPYAGRRNAAVRGPAGELLELIEIG